MDHNEDAKQVQDLAKHLTAQFKDMRPTLINPSASSSAAAREPTAVSEVNITQLAAQLGQLLRQNTSTEQEREQEQQQRLVEPITPTADPFATVPDPSIYEKEFTDVHFHVNASVLRFEDRELLVRTFFRMSILEAQRTAGIPCF